MKSGYLFFGNRLFDVSQKFSRLRSGRDYEEVGSQAAARGKGGGTCALLFVRAAFRVATTHDDYDQFLTYYLAAVAFLVRDCG
jgi:hypothetical protein